LGSSLASERYPMTDHDLAEAMLTDLDASDDEGELIKGGAPLVIDLSPVVKITIGIPALGL
jgi:hypothetical protein